MGAKNTDMMSCPGIEISAHEKEEIQGERQQALSISKRRKLKRSMWKGEEGEGKKENEQAA